MHHEHARRAQPRHRLARVRPRPHKHRPKHARVIPRDPLPRCKARHQRHRRHIAEHRRRVRRERHAQALPHQPHPRRIDIVPRPHVPHRRDRVLDKPLAPQVTPPAIGLAVPAIVKDQHAKPVRRQKRRDPRVALHVARVPMRMHNRRHRARTRPVPHRRHPPTVQRHAVGRLEPHRLHAERRRAHHAIRKVEQTPFDPPAAQERDTKHNRHAQHALEHPAPPPPRLRVLLAVRHRVTAPARSPASRAAPSPGSRPGTSSRR